MRGLKLPRVSFSIIALNGEPFVWLFDLICAFAVWRYRRRQLIAIAKVL